MTTYFASDAEIDDLVHRFLSRTLPKARWTHAAHFAGGLWLLRDRGLARASRDMPGLIHAYNESVGGVNSDTAGYHETITQASLRAASDFAAAREGMALHAVLDELMASPLGQPGWLFGYWSKELLMSPAARRAWVAPDLAPLPCPAA